MNYKSFTEKNKIQNIELNNGIQLNDISLQKLIEKNINLRGNNTQPKNLILTNIIQWDSDWELMDYILTGSQYREIWKNWSIPIGRINKNLINNFQVEIICKNGINGELDSSNFEISASLFFKKFIGWDIKDIEGNEGADIKDVTLIASIYSNLNPQPLFYTKLLVKYIDQSNRD